MKQLPIILSLMSLAVAAGAYDVSPSGLSDGTDAAAIQSAIDAAAAGGGGVVRLADGTYHLTSPVTVPAGVELVGNDANRTAVVLDGAGSYRLLNVTGNSALVHGMTFANGYSSLTDNWYHGPVYITAGTVSNCVHRGGRGRYTGALCLGPSANGAEAYVRDTLVYDCTGTDTGGAGIGGGLRLCGSKKAVADGCTVSNCWQGNGYAVYINNAAAQLLSSTITHGSKGGVRIDKDALVSNCVIRANSAPGVYQGNGTVRNSLITGNTASNGGGVYKTGGSLISCTVAGNTATVSGQGVYQTGGTIRDCIIWHNGSSIFLTEEPSLALAGGTCTYTCAAAAPSGNGNIPDKLPAFADPANGDYSLTASSPCRGAAQNGADMGWRPYAAPSTPRASFSYAVADGAAPATVAFSAALEGDYGAATSYTWVFGDGSAADTSSGATASHTYAAPGRFSVSLEVETTRGGTLRYAVANAVNLGVDTVHVVAGAGAGTFPYATEATACSDIFTAVRAVVCSESRPGRVIVHAGTFSSAVEQIILDKPVEVVGAGPDITVLDLNANSGKHRGFFLSHPLAKVRDLTVKRAYWGATEQNGASGARIDTGLVSNCVFRSCKAQYIGSVCVNGADARLLDCEIHGGYHSDSGGAGRGGGLYQTAGLSSGCIVSNCTGNSNGGGVYITGGTITNFLIRGCSVSGGQGRAGGLYVTGSSTLVADVVVDGCSMKKNGGYGGGGVYIDNGTLTDAVVTNCSVTYLAGGGIYMAGGTVARTVVAECTAKTTGGGIRQTAGTINHATVTRNSADSDASGIYQTGGSVLNSIVFGNGTATGSTAVNFASTTATITYSCAPELTVGTGNNITDNPLLRDAPAGDFRLLAASPCIGTADDDGDMGAVPYVFDPTAAPTLTLAVDVAGVISPVTATFSAVLDGTPPAAIVKYVWTFGDGQTAETAVAETTHVYSGYGLFTASVEVIFANDTSLTATLTDAVGSWSDVAYVNPLSATPQSPYETPEKAATTIGDALSVVQVTCLDLPLGRHLQLHRRRNLQPYPPHPHFHNQRRTRRGPQRQRQDSPVHPQQRRGRRFRRHCLQRQQCIPLGRLHREQRHGFELRRNSQRERLFRRRLHRGGTDCRLLLQRLPFERRKRNGHACAGRSPHRRRTCRAVRHHELHERRQRRRRPASRRDVPRLHHRQLLRPRAHFLHNGRTCRPLPDSRKHRRQQRRRGPWHLHHRRHCAQLPRRGQRFLQGRGRNKGQKLRFNCRELHCRGQHGHIGRNRIRRQRAVVQLPLVGQHGR